MPVFVHFHHEVVGVVDKLVCRHCGEEKEFHRRRDFNFDARRRGEALRAYQRAHSRECAALQAWVKAVAEGEARRLELEEGPLDAP